MNADINQLCPELQSDCREFLLKCKLAHLDVRILFTYRTPTEQDAKYAQGRTTPGHIITKLKGDKSKHCHMENGKPSAKAFDFGIFDNGNYITDGNDFRYKSAGEIGKALGLNWGGDWHNPFDPSHLEIA